MFKVNGGRHNYNREGAQRMCTFNKDIIASFYQVCSCGKHMWSMRAQKVINIQASGPYANHFYISDKNGMRYYYFYYGNQNKTNIIQYICQYLCQNICQYLCNIGILISIMFIVAILINIINRLTTTTLQ